MDDFSTGWKNLEYQTSLKHHSSKMGKQTNACIICFFPGHVFLRLYAVAQMVRLPFK